MYALPETGFLRLRQIIGDPKAKPPVVGVFPISRSSWYAGIAAGHYPKPIRLGPRTAAWRIEDIRALISTNQ
ncbi:hypothetical protein BH10PSE11_BH10PSE11_04020 [soil metagenome]